MAGSNRFPSDRDAPIEQSAPGEDVVIAAVPGRRIVVHAFFFTLSSSGTVRFRSGVGGRDITGALEFDPKGGMVVPSAERAYFGCDEGDALVIVSTGGAAHGGVSYSLED